jgi:asparagine synthase (glutamine-hydrolysing)
MCGIAGVAALRGGAVRDLKESVAAMCLAIRHRGPDDNGVELCAGGHVALGNQRLAIRDLSPAGHMPMVNAAGTVRITYNGEIYNAADLRRELERQGLAFRSTSDTEVILHGYERWGEQVVLRLRGMFAFAIVDERGSDAKLFLARDPLGIKPLYYATSSETIVFASECRAIVRSGFVSREISPGALVTYLRLGSVPAPLTIYRDIRALTAGTTLTIDLSSPAPHAEPRTYWTLPPREDRPRTHDEVRALLVDSVTRHLVSDVPLGAFLSGGIDSSAIVGLTREALPQSTIRTCTLAFERDNSRDVSLARVAARAFNTEHIEVPITTDDVARDLEHIVTSLDQPSNDGVNTYLVSKAARSAGLTVALSGIGGDELFGGYATFWRLGPAVRAAAVTAAVPGAAWSSRAAAAAVAPNHPVTRMLDWTAESGSDPAVQYLGLRGLFAESAIANLVTPDVLSNADAPSALVRLVRDTAKPSASIWDAASRFELTCYMRHQLLRDADVMSMAHSLEVRVPFVDRDVVEAVLTLPVDMRAGDPPKQLLRSLVPNLPPEIRDRAQKDTFTLPLDRWMAGPLRPQLGALIERAEDTLRGVILPGAGRRVLADFDTGRAHWSRAWAIAALATITAR